MQAFYCRFTPRKWKKANQFRCIPGVHFARTDKNQKSSKPDKSDIRSYFTKYCHKLDTGHTYTTQHKHKIKQKKSNNVEELKEHRTMKLNKEKDNCASK